MTWNAERVIIAADLHLKPCTWAKHPRIRGDAYTAFEWIVAYAINARCPLVLLGDVFDSKTPDSRSVQVFRDGVVAMAAAGLDVMFIQGNHDEAEPPWCGICGARSLHRVSGQLGGRTYYAIDYTHPGHLAEQLEAVPDGTELLLAHQAWNRIMGDHGDAAELAAVPTVRSLISGDYHDYAVVESPRRDGEPVQAISPGSTHLTRLNHSPRKYVLELSDAGARPVPIRHVRPFASVELTLSSDWTRLNSELDRVVAEGRNLPPDIQLPLIRVRYMPQFSEELRAWSHIRQDMAYFVCEPAASVAAASQDWETKPTGLLTLAEAARRRLEAAGASQYATDLAVRLANQSADVAGKTLQTEVTCAVNKIAAR